MTDRQAALNTDRELWRGPDEGGGDFYADSIHVTKEGGIGINVGGHVIVKSLRDWHALAVFPAQSKLSQFAGRLKNLEFRIRDVQCCDPIIDGLLCEVRELRDEFESVSPHDSKRPTRRELINAVKAVLKRGEWPEYYTADDRGLEQEEYVDFIIEVLAAIPSHSQEVKAEGKP